MARKFIITETRMLMGNVEYHKDLLPKSRSMNDTHSLLMNRMHNHHQAEELKETAKGGGRWHMDADNKILYLWGASADFGPCTAEELKEAIAKPDTWISARMEDWDIHFSKYISDTLPALETFEFLMKVPE